MIDVKSIAFTDKFSAIGAPKLIGNIGGRITATIECFVHWETIEKDLTFYGDLIVRNDGGSWIADGFRLGDTIEVVVSPTYPSGSLPSPYGQNAGTFEITGITADQLSVAHTGSDSASWTSLVTEIGHSYYAIHGVTPVTSMDFYYGLVENSASPTYTSLIDGETQWFRSTGLDQVTPVSVVMSPQGSNKSWLTGKTSEQATSTITPTGIGTSGVSWGYEQCFEIVHVFHIAPSILDGWEDSNGNLDQSLISFLAGSASIKYVPRIVAGYTNGSTEHNSDTGNASTFVQPGDVGFYDEYRNTGAVGNYTVSGLVYKDSGGNTTNKLQYNGTTTVDFVITDSEADITNSSQFDVYIFVLPDDASDYSNLPTDAWTNFDVSNVTVSPGGGSQNHNKITGCTATGNGASTTISLTYADNTGTARKHLIYVECCDPADNDVNTADKTSILVDYRDSEFYLYIPDNVITLEPRINEHSSNDWDDFGYSDFKGWVEDGLLIQWPIRLLKLVGNASNWSLSMRDLKIEIIAENATDSTLNFVLETDTLISGTNSNRGFVLPTADPKNYRVLTDIGDTGTRNRYNLAWATKIRYEDWLAQTNANITDFPNADKNWSDFITGDWSIKAKLTIECRATKGSETETVDIVVYRDIVALNYEEYFNCIISGEIDTFHADSGDDLGGQLSKTSNTIVRARAYGKELFPCIYQDDGTCAFTQITSGSGSFSNSDAGLDGCPEYYGILELDKGQYGGSEFNIEQASTLYALATGIAWVNQPTIVMYPYAATPYIEMLGEIDVTMLDQSVPSYKLSARFGRQAETICRVSIMARLENGKTYSNNGIDGFTVDELLVFGLYLDNPYYEQTCWNVSSVIGDTINFTVNVSDNIKVCCSVDAELNTVTGDFHIFASLVGLTSDDFLLFSGNDFGREVTTSTGFSFNSGTGRVDWPFGSNNPTKISFHQAIISDTLAGALTYTDSSLAGLNIQDVMIFVEGQEITVAGIASISGTTITFASAQTGPFKVCRVSQ